MKRATLWLCLTAVASLVLAVVSPAAAVNAPARQMSSEPGIYMSSYRTAVAPPDEVGEFHFFALEELPGQGRGEFKIDADGNVSISGRLHTTTGTVYRFKAAKLIKGAAGYEQLTFSTAERDGVHYSFKGKFTDDSELVEGQYITLTGVLTRYKGGRKVASSRLGLHRWISA